MASYTSNLHLKMPGNNDQVNVSDFNNNFEALDTAYGDMQESVADVSTRAKVIRLTSSDTSWPNVWAKISTLATYEAAVIYAAPAAFNQLTGDTSNTASLTTGTITRTGANAFGILAKVGQQGIQAIQLSNVTSTSRGNVSVRKYSEIPASKMLQDSDAKTTRTITLPNAFRGFIVGVAANTARCFLGFLFTSSAGAISLVEVNKGSGVTFGTSEANKLTITYPSNSTGFYYIFADSNSNLQAVDFYTE